jgi:hypothetical protein
VQVGLAIVTVVGTYLAMAFGRASDAFSGSPALGAWAPLSLPMLAALALWAYARITRKGVYADV